MFIGTVFLLVSRHLMLKMKKPLTQSLSNLKNTVGNSTGPRKDFAVYSSEAFGKDTTPKRHLSQGTHTQCHSRQGEGHIPPNTQLTKNLQQI